MTNQNPWKTLNSKIVYKNPWIKVREDQVIQPDGKEGIYGVVELSGKSVGIIPFDGTHVYLVGQFRYTFQEYTWEIPAGTAKKGESPLEAAKRELSEEAGLFADTMTEVSVSYPSNGFSTEELHIFIAENLIQKEQHLDATEQIIVRKVLLEEAIQMVERFEIKDVVSVVAIQYLQIQQLKKRLG